MPTIQEALDDLVSNTTSLQDTVSGRITDMDGKIVQASSAKADAETAKLNAEIAETSAQTAQSLAETARDVANTAKVDAQSAKSDALAAQSAASSAQTSAEAARDASIAADVSASTHKTDSQTAKNAAVVAQGNAETAETNTSTSASAANAHKIKAGQWADNAEDASVETGKYSAKHWSAKAAIENTAAGVSEGNALASKNAAATSEGVATTKASAASASATASASSASTATTKAAEGVASASSASGSASTATTKASEAVTSASNAASSASSAASAATTAVNAVIDTAPANLNTLNELAAALGDDANYAATTTTALGNRYTKSETDAKIVALSPPATKAHVDSLGINAATLTGSLPAISGGNLTGIDAVSAQALAPANPEQGTLWMDTDDDKFWIFNSNGWVLVSEPSPKFTELRNASGTVVTRGGAGSTIVVIGEEFKAGTVITIGGNTAITTMVNSTAINLVIPAGTQGTTHNLVITQPSGLQVTAESAFTYNRTPAFSNSGTMGEYEGGSGITISANATDGDGDGLIYTVISGSLPPSMSINASTGAITGTPAISTNGTFSWTTEVTDGFESITATFSVIITPPYKYQHIYAHSFTGCGYKDGSPWKNVNNTTHSTDTTVDLGDRFDYPGGYIDAGWDDTGEKLFMHSSTNTHSAASTRISSYNMRTDTSLGSNATAMSNRNDMGVACDQRRRTGYSGGGGITGIDKASYVNDTATHVATYGSSNAGAMGTAWGGEDWGWFNVGTNDPWKIQFSTDTVSTWSKSYNTEGCQKAMGSKNGYGLMGRDGSCGNSTGGNWDEYDDSTGSHRWYGAKPIDCGEENYSTGQDKGYMMGNYDAGAIGGDHGQNNRAFVYNYAARSGSELGSAGQPKGHGGCSSGGAGSRKA